MSANMKNACDSNGGDAHTGSEMSPPPPHPLRSNNTNANSVVLSSTPHLPSNNPLWHRPPPTLPPFCSSWQFEPSNATSSTRSQIDYKYNQHSNHPLTLESSTHSPPIFAPYQKSSIANNGMNLTTTNTNPSSEPSLPPLFHPHNPPTVIQPCHIKSSMGHTINSATSTCSRDSTLNSSVSSNVNSLTRDGSCFTPTTKPTIHIPGPYNQSRDSRVSSLTTSSTVSGALSIVPTSNAQHDISTPKSNLTSYDMVGILNGKSPDLLYLPSDFLPTNKKHINEIHGRKFWTYAVHFDRSLPKENPDESQLASFLTKLNSFYEEIHDNLTKCLLSHLMVGSFSR